MAGDVIARSVFVLILVAAFLGITFIRSRSRRWRAGDKWARRHQAYIAPEWVAEVDRQLETNRRLDLGAWLVLFVTVSIVPRTDVAWGACLATLPALVMLTRGVLLGRDLPRGPRVARLREVSLSDYVSSSTRWVMWGAAIVSCGLTVAAAVRRTSPVLLVPGAVLLLGAAVVEVSGKRLARRPEPAIDASHLYWQDCLRVDAVRTAAGMSVLATWILLQELPFLDVPPADFDYVWSLVYAVGLSGLFVAAIGAVRAQDHPVDHMRSRLWPTLRSGQVLMPGEALPIAGGAS
jgi:hypothetical protein